MTSPSLPPDALRAVTRERLRLLSIGFYISGAIGAVCVSFLIIHLTVLSVLSFVPESAWNHDSKSGTGTPPLTEQSVKKSDTPPVIVFRIAAGVIGFIILTGWTLGGLTIYAGHCIKKRQRRTFVLIMAGANCIWIPYGTLLGVSTFLTLSSPDAKEEYPG